MNVEILHVHTFMDFEKYQFEIFKVCMYIL